MYLQKTLHHLILLGVLLGSKVLGTQLPGPMSRLDRLGLSSVVKPSQFVLGLQRR
jgi:hypothetical protein